ncbi:MAG: DUF2207 domain-containing protein [Bacteroidota bacterium]
MKTRLLRHIALWTGGLLLAGTLAAQGFTIDRFRSDIYLRRDGAFEVVETIEVDFSEPRHGIRRIVPYRYVAQPVEGELALNHLPGLSYTTPLDSVRVIGHAYQVQKEADNYNLRIGSADRYVRGKVTYEIRYIVYAATNRFLNHDELYWNVNGNGWDVPAALVEAEVHLPDGRRLPEADVRAFTGRKGEKGGAATIETTPGGVEVRTTREMQAHEGLTLVLRLPKNYLKHGDLPLRVTANEFVIHDLQSVIALQPDGSVVVEERLDLEIKAGVGYIERRLSNRFPYSWLSDNLEHHPVDLKVELEEVYAVEEGRAVDQVRRFITRDGYLGLQLAEKPAAGRRTYHLRYRVWNAMDFALGEGRLYFPWINYRLGEPVVNARCVVRWPEGMVLDTARSTLFLSDLTRMDSEIAADSLVLTATANLLSDFTSNLALVLHGNWTPRKTPMRLYSPAQYNQHYRLNLELRKNGSVRFSHDLAYINRSPNNYYTAEIRTWFLPWMSDSSYTTGIPHQFGSDGRFLLYDLDSDAATDSHSGLWGTILEYSTPKRKDPAPYLIRYAYTQYGMLLEAEDGGYRFNFPVIESYPFASDSVQFTIAVPDDLRLDTSQVQVFALPPDGGERLPAELAFFPGRIEGTLNPGLLPESMLLVDIRLPAGTVSPSPWLELRLLFRNHPMLFLPLLVLLVLGALWFIFGRDKRFTKVVRFYPPEDLTPTEAGLLIDDKLHNRDLLALIYYWGAQGLVRISEVPGEAGKPKDYTLIKLRKLPKRARKYERTLFNALFLGRKTVRVSKLRQQFYVYMQKARREVEDWAKKTNYYVPGTRGFGRILRGLGIVLLGLAVLFSGYNFFFISPLGNGSWGPVIGWAGSGILCLLFARIMPRHGVYGLQKYAELVGFAEFVRTAEKDRLERLVDEDPQYFGLTLSYAIALGLANRWVEKFGPLLSEPPTYYRTTGTDRPDFDAADFNVVLTRQLNRMSQDFNSTPPSSGSYSGGSGGYRGGSSWSSSSSSFGSSGGSGFSGGGSSGGGYGGGGGSSW